MSPIGFIGLGDIGLPMAQRLLDVKKTLIVWNRTASKADTLTMRGAERASSAQAVAARCDLVGLCLTSDDAVEEVVFGDRGLVKAERPLTIVNLSTGAPDKTIAFAARAARQGMRWIDAPVSGGAPAAAAGRLTIFLGSDDADISAAAPLLEALAAHSTHMGPAGTGQVAKLCNQMIVATNLLVIAETIAAARAAGVDVACLPAALRGGFADSIPLQLFGPRMAEHQFHPRLGAVALMEKDIKLACTVAAAANARTPLADLSLRLLGAMSTTPGLSAQDDLSTLIGLFEGPLPT